MRYFIATVYPQRVEIQEHIRELTTYDCSAAVDGDIWRYKIKKSASTSYKRTGWRDAAYATIHWHAFNNGTVVRFEPVHQDACRPLEIHKKQRTFW